MSRSKRMILGGLLVVAITVAISLNHLPSPRALQSSSAPYSTTATVASKSANPFEDPYASEAYEPTAAETEASFQVEFPADYRERFVQYVTVDCPNSRTVRKMFVNPQTLASLKTSSTLPSGTVLVMETHSARSGSNRRLAPTRLNNVFVREKRDGWRVNEDSGAWRSAWYNPEKALVSNNQNSCIGCHTMVSDRDYVFTLPALLTTARTDLTQHQDTEFGTSVCR